MHFLTLVYRNISRRRSRSILTVSGVAIAVGAVVALVGIARGFESSLLDLYVKRGTDLKVFRAGSMLQFSSVLDASLGEKLASLPGVREVSPSLYDQIALEKYNLFGVVVQGMPLDSPPMRDAKIVKGRRIEPGDQRAVLLGANLAARTEKKVGDDIEVVGGETFQVVGIYENFNVFEDAAMLMSMAELQKLMARDGEVTGFDVVAERGDRQSLDELRTAIKGLAPAIDAKPTLEYVENSAEIRMAQAVAWLTSTIALVIGTIGMVNTMMMAVFERTRELAVLRAIGWRKRRVMKLILWESLALAVVGAVVGTICAIGLTQVLSRLPASGRMVSGEVSAAVIFQGFAIALIVGVAGGIYPAYRAAQAVPTEGLRHE